ncbi:MAG: GNAT family N-acetyltransferase [Pseudomonadota bacterium]
MTGITAEIPTIETKSLLMRGWEAADHEVFTANWKRPDWNEYIGGFRNRDDVWNLMCEANGSWSLQGFGFMAVTLKETGELIGMGGPICPGGWPEPEIGWSIFPNHQGQGFATEMATAALRFVYGELGWTTAISLIDARNGPSMRVATKLGASLERHSVPVTQFVADIWRHLPPEQFFKLHGKASS